jgi:hypothetical protein
VRLTHRQNLFPVRQQLERKFTAELEVANAIHDAVAATTQFIEDFVTLRPNGHTGRIVDRMATLGLSCNISDGRFLVRGVSLENGKGEQVFHHRAATGEDEALQLLSLSNALATRLADLPLAAVVVRAADHHHAARMTDVAAQRLRAEGVLLATARTAVPKVVSLTGKEIGDACGDSKAAVDKRAADVLSAAAAEATAAALAAYELVHAD